jgi:thiosulfate/3-mercaptopyruvate sulfurtransferase
MTTSIYLALLLTMPLEPTDSATAKYPKPDLIIEADDLARRKAGDGPVIVDVRKRTEYDQGHIPRAVWLDAGEWAKAFVADRDSAAWSKRIGKLGVDGEHLVFVYGDPSKPDAARIWWILRYWGLKDVRLVNGGWPAWQQGGHGVSTEPATNPTADPKLSPQSERLAVKEQMLKWVGGKDRQIVDARSRPEYCGTKEMAKRSGAIPGATHLEWLEVLDPTTHKFKKPDELRKLFSEKGIDLNRPSVAHCQSGGRSSVMAFALELMGAKDVRNYYRSWEEWGNAEDTPIEKIRDE